VWNWLKEPNSSRNLRAHGLGGATQKPDGKRPAICNQQRFARERAASASHAANSVLRERRAASASHATNSALKQMGGQQCFFLVDRGLVARKMSASEELFFGESR